MSDTPPLLTVAEAAELLRVSHWTVGAMTRDGRLPRVPGLRGTRIPAAAVARLMEGEYADPDAKPHGQAASQASAPRRRNGHQADRPLASQAVGGGGAIQDESGRRREMWLSAASRDEADELRKKELDKLRKGIVRTEQSVAEYVTAWLDTVQVGPGTLPRYQSHISERIVPSIGDVALRLLTPQQVRSAVIRWPGAPQTRGGALRLLRAAMKQAVADHLRETDPTAGIPG